MQSVRNDIDALTSLRFIAAFYVFLFHIHIRWPLTSNEFLASFLSQGAVGMSLFFMLSGYVLAYRYDVTQLPLREFFGNRFARIYPVYLLAALLTLPWLQRGGELGAGGIVLLVVANVLLLQAWFPRMFDYWNDGASWSISVEAFFYGLFPIIISKLRNLNYQHILQLTAAAYLAAILPGLLFVALDLKLGYGRVFYMMPIFRLSEFILGVCAYFLSIKFSFKDSPFLDVFYLVIMSVVVAYLGFFGHELPIYVTHNWIVIPVIFTGLIFLGKSKGWFSKVLSIYPLVWAGKASYCFYSFQPLVILLLIDYGHELFARWPMIHNNLAIFIVAFIFLFSLSAAIYIAIEEPARKLIKLRLQA